MARRAVEVSFWGCVAGLIWTHAGYPAAASVVARLRPRPVRRVPGFRPNVTVIVAARNEEANIERRVENLLAQTYPATAFDVLVASDGSTDRTNELVAAIAATEPRVRLLALRGQGKVAAQHRAAGAATADVLAFTDANTSWDSDALERLVEPLADPDVGYVCGQLRLETTGGSNKEGVYWRYEMWLRTQESTMGSITGGNGAIYALWRRDYIEDDPRFGHDLGFPYLMVQRGKRSVYEPAAVAVEPQALDSEDEYRRKIRMFSQAWGHLLTGRIFRRPVGPLYATALFSHRVLRYSSGLLHIGALLSNFLLLHRGRIYRLTFVLQLAFGGLALAGRRRRGVPGAGLAYYYVSVAAATVHGLVRYLGSGTPVSWDKVRGTRDSAET